MVLGENMQLYGLIFQWNAFEEDPLLIMEWIFLSYRSPKTIFTTMEMMTQIIVKARERLLTTVGQDFTVIYMPLKKEYFNWALQK